MRTIASFGLGLLLCSAANIAFAQGTGVGSRLDSFQFKSLCEMQKRMPTGQKVDCHCAANVYEKFMQRQLERYDEMVKYYEDKMQSEPEKSETYARAAQRQREQRKQFVEDSLRVDTQVFRDIIRKALQECPPER